MQKNKEDQFELVYDKSELGKIVQFLEQGFKWRTKYSKRILEVLRNNPANTPIAAVNRSSKKITTAILLFHQGKTEDNIDIINISAWFAIPEKRGALAVRFARKLVTALNSYVLTDYTASPAASAIFRRLGFRYIENICKIKVGMGISRKLPFLNIHAFKHLKRLRSQDYLATEKTAKAPVHISKIKNLPHEEQSIFYSTFAIKKLGHLVKTLNLYKMYENGPALTSSQVIFMMLKHKAISVNIYFIDTKAVSPTAGWLIFSKNKNIKFISPAGSELNYEELL